MTENLEKITKEDTIKLKSPWGDPGKHIHPYRGLKFGDETEKDKNQTTKTFETHNPIRSGQNQQNASSSYIKAYVMA